MSDSERSFEHSMQRRGRQLVWAAIGLGALFLALVAGYLGLSWRGLEASALERTALHAQVLGQQTTLTLADGAGRLQAQARALETLPETADPMRLSAWLQRAVAAQPQWLSLSLLDGRGQLVASSDSRLLAASPAPLDWSAWPAGPQAQQFIGLDWPRAQATTAESNPAPALLLLQTLNLADGADATPAASASAAASTPTPTPTPHALVAHINPAVLLPAAPGLVGAEAERSALITLDGRIVAADAQALQGVQRVTALQGFDRQSAAAQSRVKGAGLQSDDAVLAFRPLSPWPLALWSEEARAPLQATLKAPALWAALGLALAWLTIALAYAKLRRSLQKEFNSNAQVLTLNSAMAQSEERWKLALEGVGDGVWEWNIDTGEMHYSRRWKEILGYPEGEIGNRFAAWVALVHPDDIDRATGDVNAHLRGETAVIHIELRMRCKNEQWKWVLLRGTRAAPQTATDETGTRRQGRVIGTMTDINERRNAQVALATSQARRLALMQSSLDAIITIDGAGRVVDFNPAAETMFERRQADVAGRLMQDLIVPTRSPWAQASGLEGYLETGHAPMLNRRIETEALRADGQLFPVELTVVPVEADDEVAFTATLRDISGRLSSQREREHLLQRYRVVTDEMKAQRLAVDQHAIVSIFDSDGILSSVNENFIEATGYLAGELIGTDVAPILRSGEMDESVYRKLLDTVLSGAPWRGELVLRHRNGSQRWLSTTIVPMESAGDGATQFMSVQTDVTPLRQAEAALRAARERELTVGRRIQQSLLVAAPPSTPQGIWLSTFSQASQGIDGDFTEVFQPSKDCLDLIVGDVMGKGVNAALMGAAVKTQFSRSFVELMTGRSPGDEPPQPSQLLAAVHRAMTPHLQALDAFVTLSYVRIDRRSGIITWVGCGHEEAMLIRADGRMRLLRNQQPPLGVLEDAEYIQDATPARVGDALLLHSDGLTDAVLSNGERVGRDRMASSIRSQVMAHATPAAALQLMRKQILSRATLTDDLTLVLARLSDLDLPSQHLELAPKPESLVALRRLVAQQTTIAHIPEVAAGLFAVAVVEAFTNVYRHAVDMPLGAPVEVLAQHIDGTLTIDLVYLAQAYAPPKELTETRFDEFPEGGFGLTIIRKACDQVDYFHVNGVNTVRMTLLAKGQAPAAEASEPALEVA